MAASLLTVLAFAVGLMAVTAGATMIYPPAGLVVLGLALVVVSVGYSRGTDE